VEEGGGDRGGPVAGGDGGRWPAVKSDYRWAKTPLGRRGGGPIHPKMMRHKKAPNILTLQKCAPTRLLFKNRGGGSGRDPPRGGGRGYPPPGGRVPGGPKK